MYLLEILISLSALYIVIYLEKFVTKINVFDFIVKMAKFYQKYYKNYKNCGILESKQNLGILKNLKIFKQIWSNFLLIKVLFSLHNTGTIDHCSVINSQERELIFAGTITGNVHFSFFVVVVDIP